MEFVLDASVALSWCFEDEPGARSDRILGQIDSTGVLAPAIWVDEVANGLLSAERRGRLTGADVARAAELLARLPVRVMAAGASTSLGPVLALARDTGLSVYDAEYLALAIERGVPLATLDADLGAAAKRVGVTPLS